MGKLGEPLVRGLAFEALHPAADSDLGRERHEEVEVVLADMAFEEADI
jgi:hypothetical protein